VLRRSTSCKKWGYVGLALVAIFSVAVLAESASSQEHLSTEVESHHSSPSSADKAESPEEHESQLGQELPLWSVIPFIGILLSIALLPLIRPRFWHHWFPLVSAFWALLFAVPFLIGYKGEALHEILHIYLVDYFPFIILLWGLYTVSGGILIEGTFKGTPGQNTILLILGTLIASWIGTTGASMVLIRPVLRANAWRQRRVHVIIFFIFLVSNVGGSLTPLGDPPLFLGFLHEVPFFWTFHLFPAMSMVAVFLLLIFYLVDSFHYRREEERETIASGEKVPVRIVGLTNILFLAGIVGAVLFSGLCELGEVNILGVHLAGESLTRDALIIAIGILSMLCTKKDIRERNQFSWFPIKEVAYLFAGIFTTIIPALAILKAGPGGGLSFIIEQVKKPMDYFWVTGILSSFLDNAPTYLTFFNTALGTFFAGLAESEAVPRLIDEQAQYLMAISAGAVFMGANTYIGNAPNFMVKSIAEEAGIPMPSFFGYILKYSLPILIPVFIVVSWGLFT